MKNNIKRAVILLIWLMLWQVAAIFINNPIYFVSPVEVLKELGEKCHDIVFWRSVFGSLIRILAGFLAAFILAYLTAFASVRYEWLRDFLAPFVTFLKSVPVAAVVIIMLIWWGPRYLVLCISLMVVFPGIYSNMQTGLVNADKGLLEMALVFNLKTVDRFLWIYRPSYLPYLYSAASVSLGMCFKAGIAAEIIGLPEFSIGERLYRDKIYINTAGVFAWVVIILIVSSLTERLILHLFKLLAGVPKACIWDGASSHNANMKTARDPIKTPEGYTVYAKGLIKSFGDRTLINTDINLKAGHIYYLKAPSGSGKSTLLGMIAGIVPQDSGIINAGRLSMVFQDDRLIENANALRNLMLSGCTGDLKGELLKILPSEAMTLPASDLSGGERRRLAIARALLHPSDIVIMDEPFAGLDEETKERTAAWILEHLSERTLLFTSHETEYVSFENAEMIPLIK
ncbi:MAG: ATP-binding cassette domain-containing protein [Lachnospiraceae bacterium]|nr:ATP-binding cassette domain-containing protein [Lachnospiraceae bacterium]